MKAYDVIRPEKLEGVKEGVSGKDVVSKVLEGIANDRNRT
jgi:hypothetical protein